MQFSNRTDKLRVEQQMNLRTKFEYWLVMVTQDIVTEIKTLVLSLSKDLWSISQKVVSLRSVVSVNFNQSKAWKSHLRLILDLRLFVKSTPVI